MKHADDVIQIRKLSQKYAYTSLQMHEMIGKNLGFNGTDHKYLGHFIQKGAMTAGELAQLTGLTTGAVTGLIDRLERKKLVKRQYDKTDRRKIIIVPHVDKITKLITPHYSDFQDNTDKFLSSFTAQELKVLKKYFENAIDIMTQKILTITK